MKLATLVSLFPIAWSAMASPLAAADAAPIRPGDRVAIVGNTFADQLRIHGYLETLLLQHSEDDPILIRNLGWGGDMLTARDRPTGFPSEESTLAAHRTDVIIACFGMGESFAGEAGIDGFKRDLADFIASHQGKRYNGETEVRLVLVSPIACENLGRLTPTHERRNGELEAYTRAMAGVAQATKVPFVDLFETTRYLMEESEGPSLTTNGIHLNPFGYWAIGRILFDNLVADGEGGKASQPWELRIDAKSGDGSGRGVEIGVLDRKAGRLRFEVEEKTGPTPPPPTGEALPAQLGDHRDTLVVTNLQPGNYTLSIDGESTVTANHEAWAQGVPVDASPAHRMVEDLRAAINDKNLQFTYGWKALNQVHIVGERRKSPSGQALPAEVVEFDRLAKQREAELPDLIERKIRIWQLTPAEG